MTTTLNAKPRTRKPATRKRAAKPADAPREVEWAKLLDHALNTPGSVGNTYRRFYNYSYLNCLLLAMQGAQGPVATYKRWAEIGRQVQKGSKAMEIVRPITIKKADDEDPDKVRTFQRFKPVRCIFDFPQTDGADLPPFELPAWDLDVALTALDIKRIPYTLMDGNTQGYSRDRVFAINPVAVYPTKTTLHELAHILLGHTVPDYHAEYARHRGLAEFQAEAVAYLTMKELGHDDGSESVSRGYIQGWLGSDKPGDAAIRQVFSAVTKLVDAGRPATTTTDTKED